LYNTLQTISHYRCWSLSQPNKYVFNAYSGTDEG